MTDRMIFTPLLIGATLLFLWSCYKKFALVKLGSAENRFDRIPERIKSALTFAIGQKRVVKGHFGINHAVLFWSFLILVALNIEFLLNGAFPAISFTKLPDAIFYPLKGVFDLVSLLVLLAVSFATLRKIIKPLYPESRTFEAFIILTTIALLMLAYFGLNATEMALGRYQPSSLVPISSAIATLFRGLTHSAIEQFASLFWWAHAVLLLGFLNFLPYSKHMHILTAVPNCYFKELEEPILVPRERFEKGEIFGVGQVDHFSWKDLFDSYTCTECGRCQHVCPAFNTDKPLNPRTLIHSIKQNLLENAKDLKKGAQPSFPLISDTQTVGISEDSTWSCVTCGACMEECPVFIEHVPKIIKMRRHLVETESKFPKELLSFFENMEQRSNPWGIVPTERAKWHSNIDVKEFEENKTEYLFYVGCAGAFDARNKQVTLAMTMILDKAGLSWGVLGKNEMCCGDSARKLGNEYLFEEMVLKNVEVFKEKGVKKIITQCPHCFSTLKNDYKQFGIELDVIHHSQLINELLTSGKLQLEGKGQDMGVLTFHDSCYLGRHNGVYDAPRQALEHTSGKPVVEMEQHHEKSFCCGAGGGRMWMEENLGSRINQKRVEQAVATDADTVCVACPYCLTMYEDGIKEVQTEKLKAYDLAEIVARKLN